MCRLGCGNRQRSIATRQNGIGTDTTTSQHASDRIESIEQCKARIYGCGYLRGLRFSHFFSLYFGCTLHQVSMVQMSDVDICQACFLKHVKHVRTGALPCMGCLQHQCHGSEAPPKNQERSCYTMRNSFLSN